MNLKNIRFQTRDVERRGFLKSIIVPPASRPIKVKNNAQVKLFAPGRRQYTDFSRNSFIKLYLCITPSITTFYSYLAPLAPQDIFKFLLLEIYLINKIMRYSN